jgi:DNA segregation ATPase FtsK/SpoIIIE-like protein
MASSDRNSEMRRKGDRVVPSLDRGYSRASRAVGGQGSISSQRVEQRAKSSAPKQGSRSGGSISSKQAQLPRSRQGTSASSGRGSAASAGKGNNSSSRSQRPVRTPPETNNARDTSVPQRILDKWNSFSPNQQQRISHSLLLVLSLFLFGSLTVLHSAPIWSNIGTFFLNFLGWAAYVLGGGFVIYAGIRVYESVRQRSIIRSSMVLGLVVLCLLVLLESRLIMGSSTVGVLADLLAMPFQGWPPAVGHVLVIGLILVITIFTFRITFAHVLMVYHFVERLMGDAPTDYDGDGAADSEDVHARFLGQRPQFSRYSAGRVALDDSEDFGDANEPEMEPPVTPSRRLRSGVEKPPQQQPTPGRARASLQAPPPEAMVDEEIYFDDGFHSYDDYSDKTIAIEPEAYPQEDYADDDIYFDDEDPLNDINLHKQQISAVPRGTRDPQPLDLNDHTGATRGARQQALAFSDKTVIDQDDDILDGPPLDEDASLLSRAVAPPAKPVRKIRRLENVATPAPVSASAARGVQAAAIANMSHIQSSWRLPTMDILQAPDSTKLQLYGEDTAALAKLIQDTLRSFRVEAEVREEDISIGPTIIRFGIRPTGRPQMILDEKSGKSIPARDSSGQIVYETRTRVSRIMALQNDLALVMEAKTIRMEAPVPGRPYVGVEIPNKNSRLVTLREVLESKEFQTAQVKSKITIGLGKDVAGVVRVSDLAKMPHLLIAGATGAGKSVMINTIIASILMQSTPDDVRLLMVDPKMVELNMYNGIPHLLSPVVVEVDKVVSLLKNGISEMERRYRLFSQLGVRNLDGYRKLRAQKQAQGDISLVNLPAIVIIIDELADLMMAAPDEVEGMICRLAQLARATGIHLVVATQRPSVDVITGLIKANIPTRISFMVSSAVDSRTIIDMGGAERLLGRGDMLYLPADAGRPERIQGSFLTDDEAQRLAEYWQQQVIEHARSLGVGSSDLQSQVEPGWELKVEHGDEFELEDDLLDRAEDVVREQGRASISLLQRRLKVGYSRAARLIDLLEDRGIIGQSVDGGRAREVYDNVNHGGDGHSLSDVADDIMDEEQARNEFLRNQASRYQTPRGQGAGSRAPIDEGDDQ